MVHLSAMKAIAQAMQAVHVHEGDGKAVVSIPCIDVAVAQLATVANPAVVIHIDDLSALADQYSTSDGAVEPAIKAVARALAAIENACIVAESLETSKLPQGLDAMFSARILLDRPTLQERRKLLADTLGSVVDADLNLLSQAIFFYFYY